MGWNEKYSRNLKNLVPRANPANVLPKIAAKPTIEHVLFCSTCCNLQRAKKSGRMKISLPSVRKCDFGWLVATTEFAVSSRFFQPIGAVEPHDRSTVFPSNSFHPEALITPVVSASRRSLDCLSRFRPHPTPGSLLHVTLLCSDLTHKQSSCQEMLGLGEIVLRGSSHRGHRGGFYRFCCHQG